MKRLVLLGASGSIGTQTIQVVLQHPEQFQIVGLSVGHQIQKLHEILQQITVDYICVQSSKDMALLQQQYPDLHFFAGDQGLLDLLEMVEYDVLVNALVGFVGFLPTLKAIETHHDVALANKETLVVGGELIKQALDQHQQRLFPIDSEHSAIFQCLQGNQLQQVKRLLITASGGSFRHLNRQQLQDVTVEQALAHPNWAMGAKITIDSATMMNKGFEVIEAHYLFDLPYEQIDVILHPQSIVHSLVEYTDHSVMAQLGQADMCMPIQYALTWPNRYPNASKPLDLTEIGTLTFAKMDFERFPLLQLAYDCGKKKGSLPCILNRANEVYNLAFRQGQISFLDIERYIFDAVEKIGYFPIETVDQLLECDRMVEQYCLRQLERGKE